MDNLKELEVNVSQDLVYANVCVDLPLSENYLSENLGLQPELPMKNNEEIELALNCAMNIKKHLTRVLENKSEPALQHQLQYVNNILQEGGMKISY